MGPVFLYAISGILTALTLLILGAEVKNGSDKLASFVVAVLLVVALVWAGLLLREDLPTGHVRESLGPGVYFLEGSPHTYLEDDGIEYVLLFTERGATKDLDNLPHNVNAFRISAEQFSGPICPEARRLEVWNDPQGHRTYRFVGCDEPVIPNPDSG